MNKDGGDDFACFVATGPGEGCGDQRGEDPFAILYMGSEFTVVKLIRREASQLFREAILNLHRRLNSVTV